MKVVVGPRIDLSDGIVAGMARALAGSDGEVISLRQVGVKDLSRPLTQAEVAILRVALRGQGLSVSRREGDTEVVGFVCAGVARESAVSHEGMAAQAGGGTQCSGEVVAVTDHINLTWRSPLMGRNDEEVGRRFPSMTGIYAPEAVLERVKAEGCIIVRPGMVLGVGEDKQLSAYEGETVRVCHHSAVSSELVPVSIVAAHMGLRVAAAVVTRVGL